MNTLTLDTTQNVGIDYQLAGLGDRILAYLIDMAIIVAYFLVLFFLLWYGYNGLMRSGSGQVVFFLIYLPVMFYDLLFEMLMHGHTPGKRAMKVRVMSASGNAANIGQYLLRWLFRLVDMSLTSGLGAVLSIALTDKNQRLGDLVAGTVVIRTKASAISSVSLFENNAINETYELHYPEVEKLSPADAELIREVVSNVSITGNTLLALQVSEKMETYLHIKREEGDPLGFLRRLLSDYRHLD